MKSQILILIISLFLSFGYSQSQQDEQVKQTIEEFFEAFHKQDTVKLKAMVMGDINMQSISVNKEGKTLLDISNYSDFLKNIASIPNNKSFREKLLGFDIKIDGNMANAWTPYEFYFDGNFSHCGVNSFQLAKDDGKWKIIYLADTRRREGCKGPS